jgi:hypothetical protein
VVEESWVAAWSNCTASEYYQHTLRDYLQLYLEGGVERVKEVEIQGPERVLQEHYASWAAYFRPHPLATIKEAQNQIAALTGIKRSETQGRE